MDSQKIKAALADGTFVWRVKRKFREFHTYHRRCYCVKNRTLKNQLDQSRCYAKLRREFASILEKGVQPEPAVKSNKVWICWFQGFEQAPELIRACLHSVQQNLPGREIILLSNENIHEYIQLPERIQKFYAQGKIGAAHYSDLLRVALLCKWGGLWLDATVLCTDGKFVDYISQLPLFVYQQLDMSKQKDSAIAASSWMISAQSNQRILLLTRDLLYAYWEKHDHICNYFLFHLFFTMATRRYREDWAAVPAFNNHSPHMLQFELDSPYTPERWAQLMEFSSIHKLQRYNTFEGNTMYQHVLDTYL